MTRKNEQNDKKKKKEKNGRKKKNKQEKKKYFHFISISINRDIQVCHKKWMLVVDW
jgi:hypothetical protein